jgi:2-hydroxyacyl-CoA lyase 1
MARTETRYEWLSARRVCLIPGDNESRDRKTIPTAGAARTLALQQADVVFLMGARFNWILHFGLPPRYAKDVKVVQLDISPESMHQNKPADVPLLGDGQAIMQQLNKAMEGRQWFHPEGSAWRQALANKAKENADMIAPQINDDSAPGGYYRLFKDIREWLPKNVVLCSEGATTMDIGGTQMPLENPRSYLNAGSYGTMGVGLGIVIASCVVHPDRPVVHISGDSAIGFSGMEMETLCRYNMPAKIVILNNGGIGPGMPEIPADPMLNMRPNTLIYGARYDKMMQSFGGYGAYVEDPKDVRSALDELMSFPGPGVVNIKLSQGSQRKAQAFRWHT